MKAMTVKEIKEKLDDLGVVYSQDAKKADLQELLKSTGSDSDGNEDVVITSNVATTAKVYNGAGGFIRAYTKELHGQEFDRLAEEFVNKNSGYTVEYL